MAGFSFTMDFGGQFLTSFQITGKAYRLDRMIPTLGRLATAVGSMQTTYTDTTGCPNKDASRINLRGGTLGGSFGGQTALLMADLYTFGSGVIIANTIYFNGNANPNRVFTI
jgi:hypothetical protein